MKFIRYITLLTTLCSGVTLFAPVDVGVGVGVGGGYGGWGYGPGVGVGIGFSSGPDERDFPIGIRDTKGRDYWRIDNLAPFAVTVQTDRDAQIIYPGKSHHGRHMVRVYRGGSFQFNVSGGGRSNTLFSNYHNLTIGLDPYGNLQIINQWTQ